MEEQQNSPEWEAPPPPEKIADTSEPAQMSEVGTLANVFIEPGRTFEDLKRKPRFIIGIIILAILGTAYMFALNYKIGEENTRRYVGEQIDKSPQGQGLTPSQREGAVEINMKVGTVVRYIFPLLVIAGCFIGGLFYWLGAKAFGGTGGFLHGVAVMVYSSIPPAVVSMVANALVLIFKSADEIDLSASQRGVVHANPSMFIDGKANPVIATLLGNFDVFLIWGWILAAIGLQKMNKISSGSAWAITIILALIGIGFKLIGAVFSGNPS
jgi:hypothetical protein